jgi:16S rRNA processing protein RimM
MTPDWDALVTVGRIARPHGLRGHVVVNLETDFPAQRFQAGAALWVRRGAAPEAMRIAEVWFHQGRPVVRFEGVDRIEDAEALGRGDLRIEPAALGALSEGTFRHDDLIGCEVTSRDGLALGTVARIDGAMASSRLIVRGGSREYMIPLAADICVEIDPALRRIVVSPPEGLLDL